MKVRALRRGTYPHDRERERGEVFDYDGPTKITRGGKEVDYFPSWMEKLEEPKKTRQPPAKDDKADAAKQ